jgi:hypothetical protein
MVKEHGVHVTLSFRTSLVFGCLSMRPAVRKALNREGVLIQFKSKF